MAKSFWEMGEASEDHLVQPSASKLREAQAGRDSAQSEGHQEVGDREQQMLDRK